MLRHSLQLEVPKVPLHQHKQRGEHAGNAASSENAARESATAAVNAAGAAEASATQAASSAASAESSAGTATTKAGEASASAASAAAAAEVATANLETALPASAYIKDVSRHAVERASGGRQTVLYDDLGNPSVMNIIPIFRYEDLGYSEDMGAGVVSCFDVGTGTNKSEIFIGAFQSSLVGSRAVSLPRADPAASVNFDAAKGYCANKGAGWHLMTMHEWAAISLWCMANGFEPRGNTNYGRAHDRYVERGRRMDGGLPGDTAGIVRVHAGSGPDAWRHNNSPWGISDLVGNVWEWLDGFKLQDGQIIASTFNTQAEASWAAQAAYFDSTLTTGGAARLSDAVVNRLGTIGDNTGGGYSANAAFNAMGKAGTYVSNQLLKRLLVEPSTVLPKGRVYMRNFGERLPFRGGNWGNGGDAGLAALGCSYSRVGTGSNLGFRLAFA
ncbi:SUMF1/EgtB/PvdO family nonheme iron enzyme [Citrobacter freundii]|uniref:SUMF1/EgtB/PvdO family nonheme iron enzyme n=1 Tax=Citrobacter freundii TaxID=546 RepID=UPI002F96D584